MKVLVVARYRENIAWLDNLPPGWLPEVVEKDVDLPNRGREPSSYLHAMIELYPIAAPSDTFGFVQGNPFDHCPDLMVRLTQPVEWFDPLGTHPYQSDAHGGPHHAGVPVGDCHARWLGEPMGGEVEFWAGGQFLLTGAALLSRPVGWYRAMYDDLMSRDDLSPWAAERLWPAIFRRG